MLFGCVKRYCCCLFLCFSYSRLDFLMVCTKRLVFQRLCWCHCFFDQKPTDITKYDGNLYKSSRINVIVVVLCVFSYNRLGFRIICTKTLIG